MESMKDLNLFPSKAATWTEPQARVVQMLSLLPHPHNKIRAIRDAVATVKKDRLLA